MHRRHDHLLEADRDDRGGVHGEGERRALRIPHERNVFGEVEVRSSHLQMGHALVLSDEPFDIGRKAFTQFVPVQTEIARAVVDLAEPSAACPDW